MVTVSLVGSMSPLVLPVILIGTVAAESSYPESLVKKTGISKLPPAGMVLKAPFLSGVPMAQWCRSSSSVGRRSQPPPSTRTLPANRSCSRISKLTNASLMMRVP